MKKARRILMTITIIIVILATIISLGLFFTFKNSDKVGIDPMFNGMSSYTTILSILITISASLTIIGGMWLIYYIVVYKKLKKKEGF